MSYRIKDLSVTVLPRKEHELSKRCLLGTRICINPTDFCLYPTEACAFPSDFCRRFVTDWCNHYQSFCALPTEHCQRTIVCPGGSIQCPGGTIIPCGITEDPCLGSVYREPWVIQEVAEIDALREELRETIGRLDQLQEAGLESVQFDSVEQVEELEQRLEEALVEIRKQKGQLK